MTEPIRFSVRVNNDLTIDDTVALALAAERAEFDQFWVSNDLFFRSAPVVLSAIAQATTRIQIGTCILNPFTIDPSEIAMIAATLDELSKNRFQLGLAAGSRKFMDWVGIEHRMPLAVVRETVAIVRDLLAGKSAAISGKRFRWRDGAYLRFFPSRVTPIYIGALGPKMLRLAGEIGDGVLPLLFPPEHYHTVKPLIEEAGRELDFAACVWVSLSEDVAAARRALAEKIAYYGPALTPTVLERLFLTADDFVAIDRAVTVERDMNKASALVDERMLRIGIVGTPRDVIARLEPLVDAGARHLSFGPPLGPDPLEAVELLGRAVLPHFRA
ncbi:MAG TPA: LLM class flavin-dependent oxidoreductase [Vicinamibacteria bacterium]|nr:LLM class flavin-dependent oxidoreductase [Vicinamibacteria bacterium]